LEEEDNEGRERAVLGLGTEGGQCSRKKEKQHEKKNNWERKRVTWVWKNWRKGEEQKEEEGRRLFL
jgi:hypothetical protein